MASLSNAGAATKHIPLVCSVCPDSPRFSDVSHLLTHIASKGHLHHETQTKLKAHQDLAAAVALQQYEQWYKEHGIERLLVERMKAKQVKEIARGRRSRVGTAESSVYSEPRARNNKRRTASDARNLEHQDYAEGYPIYPSLFSEYLEPELPDDYITNTDMMSLKGQIWPGMGKMDLANDDMKRTRNQRKPKSAVDRMRRTSEGIEPTQVVMTPEFEVERIKGVYDSSSPILCPEDITPPPKKAPRPKRKRTEPLTELSVNVPRGHQHPAQTDPFTHAGRGYKRRVASRDMSSRLDLKPPVTAFVPSHDIFRDDGGANNLYDGRPFTAPSSIPPKFTVYDRLGMHSPNPISQSTMNNQTLSTRHGQQMMSRDMGRHSRMGLPGLRHNSHAPARSYNRFDQSFSPSHDSIFRSSSRLLMAPSAQLQPTDRFSHRDQHPQPIKYDDYLTFSGSNSLIHSSTNFISLSENNPLLSQDQRNLRPIHTSPSPKGRSHTPGSATFKPASYNTDNNTAETGIESERPTVSGIKVESQLCDILHPASSHDVDDAAFTPTRTWTRSTVGLDGLPTADLSREGALT